VNPASPRQGKRVAPPAEVRQSHQRFDRGGPATRAGCRGGCL
jgi:hypothetical protein